MPLVKAQCTNCGGTLDVDNSLEAAVCPYCNTPYIVEKAINNFNINNANINIQNANIQNANISVQGIQADDMFENWLVTKDVAIRTKLVEDFKYQFATDPRSEYMDCFNSYRYPKGDKLDEADALIDMVFRGQFEKYKQQEKDLVDKMKETKRYESRWKIILISMFAAIIVLFLLAILIFRT